MKNLFKLGAVAALCVSIVGCSRIETGTVGIRLDASKQIQGNELMPGTFNQTVIGDVLIFPHKDVAINLENKTPMTADNSSLADFDITVVYNINPSSVAEIYSTKSKSFHAVNPDGDTLLMYRYIETLVNNAAYKAIRQYVALEVADNRAKIEDSILQIVNEQLKQEKLDTAINISVVQVRNIAPNATILKAATELVKSQNDLKIKENEVKIAEAEARRQRMLAESGPQTIEYMRAQAQVTVANAIADGKVNTIIVPHTMTMLGAVPTK